MERIAEQRHRRVHCFPDHRIRGVLDGRSLPEYSVTILQALLNSSSI